MNNPHFLIMQGRITKVLNMKPKEILRSIFAPGVCNRPPCARARHQGDCARPLTACPRSNHSMLEEAAGTRLYELKKQAALKTIEKKQKKVEEITAVRAVGLLASVQRNSTAQQYRSHRSAPVPSSPARLGFDHRSCFAGPGGGHHPHLGEAPH